MNNPPTFVDIHCHLLPEVDDGSASWDETLAMAEMAMADGTSTIVATPHQLGSYGGNHGDAIRSKVDQLQVFLDRHGVALRVVPGADVRIEADMVRKIQQGEVLTLGDHRRHVLLELPHEVYLPLDRFLRTLGAAGLVGILSHPERNMGILGQPHVVAELVDAGCLMQVTAGSLIGAFGPQVQHFAESLVRQQLVHFIATDAHGSRSRRPLLRRAFDHVVRLVGYETAVDVCCRFPAAVVAGGHVAPPSRKAGGPRLGWFPWRKAG